MATENNPTRPPTKAPKQARVSREKAPAIPGTDPPNRKHEAARHRLDDASVDLAGGNDPGCELTDERTDPIHDDSRNAGGGTPVSLRK